VSQLAPGITTATGTLAKTYRKAGAKMPSESRAQHNLMEGIAHGWHPSGMKKAPPKSVAKDFVEADKGRDFRGMKNGKKDNGPGDEEVAAFHSSVKKRSDKVRRRRGRS
jgi:hypothetical protein